MPHNKAKSMKFQIGKREWPELTPSPELCQFWEKGEPFGLWYKAEHCYSKSESLGDSPEDAILNLMGEIEANIGITIYVGLTVREGEGNWYKPGTEAYEYDGYRRITLDEYKEAAKINQILTRGTRIKESPNEGGGEIGEAYFDGELCSLNEFDIYFTTDPICPKAKPCEDLSLN